MNDNEPCKDVGLEEHSRWRETTSIKTLETGLSLMP